MASIQLEGNTYHLRASMKALLDFEERTGTSIAALGDTDVTKVPVLLYFFAKAGMKREGEPFKLTEDEWMDMITTEDLAEIQPVLTQLLAGKKK